MYKKGDRVLFWSLQSFHGPGFYRGHPATVKQDQTGCSVLLAPDVDKKKNGRPWLEVQDCYEVYEEQCKPLDSALERLMDAQKYHERELQRVNEELKQYDYDGT